jgi:hypothetical protein
MSSSDTVCVSYRPMCIMSPIFSFKRCLLLLHCHHDIFQYLAETFNHPILGHPIRLSPWHFSANALFCILSISLMWPHCCSHLSFNGMNRFWVPVSATESAFIIPSLPLWSHLQRTIKTNCGTRNVISWWVLTPWREICHCILCPKSQHNFCT